MIIMSNDIDILFKDYIKGLIDAGKVYPGAHICESEPNDMLMKIAQEHSDYQASIGVQGHQHFDQRYSQLQLQVGDYKYAEICAESWPEQKDATPEELGHEAFKCWEASSGHWSVASVKHRFFGAGVAQGNNGIWYFCMIVGD